MLLPYVVAAVLLVVYWAGVWQQKPEIADWRLIFAGFVLI